MKKPILLAVVLVLATALTAFAETRYVTDQLEATFRSGPGNQYRIIGMISTGQRLELMETDGEWSRVEIPGRQDGWVRTQYLQPEPPARQALQATTDRLKSTEAERDSQRKENDRLNRLNRELEESLRQTEGRLQRATADYEKLQTDSRNFLIIREEHEKLTNQMAEKVQHIKELEGRIADEFLSSSIKWFLAGAGVLLLGLIIGQRSKKKRSSGLL
ncbi:TIGR04211 family SH3 domain-containing protein [Desulfurivibrio sp. D14AmB]|uniref:TIGR04211 family SH3 domain-containing protein n=1 Tax=Desulfurivibrio sp. D14AmB TaxID=3374370 RepID=UPI00376EC715